MHLFEKTQAHYGSLELDVGQQLAEVCSVLIRSGAKVTGIPRPPVAYAKRYGKHAALDLIIRHDPRSLRPPQPHGGPPTLPVLQAVALGDLRALEILILAGASPFACQTFGTTGVKSALHLCQWQAGCGIAKRLLASGVDLNDAGDRDASDTPLCYALVLSDL